MPVIPSRSHRLRLRLPAALVSVLLGALSGPVPALDGPPDFSGTWLVSHELSDDTDRQVEKAIKAAGGKVKSTGRRGRGRYRGGPPEQAFYDHLSYDEILRFHYQAPQFRLVYEGGFQRVFYSDGRGRVASASGPARTERQDYSFAYWEGDKLVVESRPRDGGSVLESYSLDSDGRLRVELQLQPLNFLEPINIVRIYNPGPPTE